MGVNRDTPTGIGILHERSEFVVANLIETGLALP